MIFWNRSRSILTTGAVACASGRSSSEQTSSTSTLFSLMILPISSTRTDVFGLFVSRVNVSLSTPSVSSTRTEVFDLLICCDWFAAESLRLSGFELENEPPSVDLFPKSFVGTSLLDRPFSTNSRAFEPKTNEPKPAYSRCASSLGPGATA